MNNNAQQIKALTTYAQAIALFPHDLTPAPTIWEASIELLTEIQIDLTNVKKHNNIKVTV